MKILFVACALSAAVLLGACQAPKKEITVVVREPGSGTRESFDRTVTDGTHFLEEYKDGKKIDRNSVYATVQTKSGNLLSSVAANRHAIGYLSLSAVGSDVKVLSINGHHPSAENVAAGHYPLFRPFILLHNAHVELTPRAADFWAYLSSDRMQAAVAATGGTFLRDPARRGSVHAPVEVGSFQAQSRLPDGEKIRLRGSTSLEKLILRAARDYAAVYGVDAGELFDIQLEGTSVGIRAAREDSGGSVIALASAAVTDTQVSTLTVALDALAVIVHPENPLSNLSLSSLYRVFSGEVRYFDELEGTV